MGSIFGAQEDKDFKHIYPFFMVISFDLMIDWQVKYYNHKIFKTCLYLLYMYV